MAGAWRDTRCVEKCPTKSGLLPAKRYRSRQDTNSCRVLWEDTNRSARPPELSSPLRSSGSHLGAFNGTSKRFVRDSSNPLFSGRTRANLKIPSPSHSENGTLSGQGSANALRSLSHRGALFLPRRAGWPPRLRRSPPCPIRKAPACDGRKRGARGSRRVERGQKARPLSPRYCRAARAWRAAPSRPAALPRVATRMGVSAHPGITNVR